MPNNENEDNQNKPEINWDNLLNDIQQELGPSPETTNVPPTPTGLEPVEKTKDGNCIYCLKCADVKLWYPQFPLDNYHMPIVQWIRVMVAPRMQHYRRCFVCIMLYMMHNPMEFNLVDQVLAEKMLHSVPDIMNNMPHLCIHENIAPTSAPTEMPFSLEEGQTPNKTPEEEDTTGTTTTREPKDIRQIIEEFNHNKRKENEG